MDDPVVKCTRRAMRRSRILVWLLSAIVLDCLYTVARWIFAGVSPDGPSWFVMACVLCFVSLGQANGMRGHIRLNFSLYCDLMRLKNVAGELESRITVIRGEQDR
jgi:hypothetical protein